MSWTDEQIAEMQRHDDQVRHTVEKLKADRDTARAEVEPEPEPEPAPTDTETAP